MKILTSKIVNGKKMFLIEDNDSQGRVFAEDGKPIKKENISYYNPYYVDVKGLNASESTKTNLTPATKITPQEIKKIKESPTNVGNIKIKEAQEKAQRLKEAEEAYKKRKAGAPITPELLAQETQAIGDKISLQNIPGIGQYIPDILDVTGSIGSMASGLGAIPLNLNRGNYGQALLSVASPLAAGALAGVGSPTVGQFVNNLANPLAGTGKSFSNAIKGADSVSQETIGYLLRNKANKKAIAEGNQWLENWINNPATQQKIEQDLAYVKSRNNIIKDTHDFGYEQAKNFKPVSAEYPLTKQIDKNIQQWLGNPNAEMPIHTGNLGVSYMHGYDPSLRKMISELEFTSPRYGSWISRTPFISQSKRIGTTIHEGTHDWTSDFLLKNSGQKQFISNLTNPEILQDYKKWEYLRKYGSNPDEVIGREKSLQAYFADPTEIHARTMELRKYFGLQPDDIIDEKRAESIIEHLEKLPFKKQPLDAGRYLKVIDRDPKKLSQLFNRLWAVPATAIGVGALGKESFQKQEKGGTVKVLKEKIVNGKKQFLIDIKD